MPSQYNAQLDSWLLNILDISDDIRPNIAKYEFVFRDGAILDNMGNSARVIKFKTYWFGTQANLDVVQRSPTYLQHKAFLADITDSTKAYHTLTHPKYGVIKGQIGNSIGIYHDDTQNYVTIDIEFIEDGIILNGSKINNFAIDKAVNTSQLSLLNGQLAKTSSTLTSSGLSEVLGKAIDFSKTIQSQLSGISTKALNFCKEADKVTGTISSFLNNVTQPINTLTNAVNYASDVPSKIVQTVQKACDRIIANEQAISKAPATAVNNMVSSVQSLATSITGSLTSGNQYNTLWSNVILSIGAGAVAQASAAAMMQDQTNRENQKAIESLKTFDDNGQRISSTVSVIDTMSQTDLENMLYVQRGLAQDAIEVDRDQPDLKNQCSLLIRFLDSIKLLKTQIVTMKVTNMPIHTLCLQLGLSYQAADRILKLNPQITNPTFVDGVIKVYTQ